MPVRRRVRSLHRRPRPIDRPTSGAGGALSATARRGGTLAVAVLAALALFAAPAAAQEWSPWRALGPFDNPGGASDVASAHAVERELSAMRPGGDGPDLEQAYRGKGGARIAWHPLRGAAAESTALDVGIIDFPAALEPPEGVPGWTSNAHAYLWRTVTTDAQRTVTVRLGSDDGVRVWLDGELLLDRSTPRPLSLQDHTLELDLAPGTHHLFVKVSHGGGGWGFQIAPWSRISQDAIDDAIDRGVAWLLERQLVDGSWGWQPEYGSGYTAFALYTLLKCGVREDHPAVRRALAWIAARPSGFTYSLACEILALATLKSGEHRVHLAERVADLEDLQGSSGLYAYPVHPGGSTLSEDLSNTLYAALACRAAEATGLDVSERTWTRFARGALRCLERERRVRASTGTGKVDAAGFSYRPNETATLSMTTAGIGVLAMVEKAAGAEFSAAMRSEIAAARAGALAWIDANMTWTKNTGGGGHHYFAVYGIERVGSLLELSRLGGTVWYWDGAEYLVGAQKLDGSWAPEHEMVDTLLALLFLKRATAPFSGKDEPRSDAYAAEAPEHPLHLRALGDTPLAVWVSGFSEQARADHAWPTDGNRGLRVERVEYLARLLPNQAEPELVATVNFDATEPCGVERFAVRHTFPERGRWIVTAKAHVLSPPPEPGLEPARAVLASGELEVVIDEILRPAQLRYATDGLENLLRERRLTCSASSHSGDQTADKVADGRQATRWHSDVADERPWVRVELDRAMQADRVLLSHAWPRPKEAHNPRPARVAIELNGRDLYELDVDPDVLAKTELVLPESQRVRSIEVRILASRDREPGKDAVGFAEIELLLGE